MKIDLYTKAILTVIAACLIYIALGSPLSPKPAIADMPMRVSIVDTDYKWGIPVSLVSIDREEQNVYSSWTKAQWDPINVE